jgi:hypothetical protein
MIGFNAPQTTLFNTPSAAQLRAMGATTAPEAPTPRHCNMTPQQILAYVEQRLGDLGGQMEDYTIVAEKRGERANDIRAYMASLRDLGSYNSLGPGVDKAAAANKAMSDIDATLAKLDDNPMENAEMIKHLEDIKTLIGGTQGTGVDLRQTVADQLATAQQGLASLNQDNEMMMMQLGQMMQARSQVIQLSSQMLASINEGAKTALSNTGR